MHPLDRSTMPFVWGDFNGARRCCTTSKVQSLSTHGACCVPLAQAEEPIYELLAIIGQNNLDVDRTTSLQTRRVAQIATPWRRKQRSRPEREAFGLRNSLNTASRSSSETATASCEGVRVVWRRYGGGCGLFHTVPMAQLVNCLLCRPIPFRQNPCWFVARLNIRSFLGYCPILPMKLNLHLRPFSGIPKN
jgi:hypothetical protein